MGRHQYTIVRDWPSPVYYPQAMVLSRGDVYIDFCFQILSQFKSVRPSLVFAFLLTLRRRHRVCNSAFVDALNGKLTKRLDSIVVPLHIASVGSTFRTCPFSIPSVCFNHIKVPQSKFTLRFVPSSHCIDLDHPRCVTVRYYRWPSMVSSHQVYFLFGADRPCHIFS